MIPEVDCCNLGDLVDVGMLAALAEPNRIEVVTLLADAGPRGLTVAEVAAGMPIHLSVVSRHLGILNAAGVLDRAQEGRHVRYRLRRSEVAGALRQIADALDVAVPAMSNGVS